MPASVIWRPLFVLALACGLAIVPQFSALAQPDPLPSWNDGAVKKSITDFVTRVTTQGGPDFVPAEQRIATFDNDGALWTEQPYYFQLAFAFDRVKAMAPQHPEWKTTQPFKALLDKDMKALGASGQKGLLEIVAATHTRHPPRAPAAGGDPRLHQSVLATKTPMRGVTTRIIAALLLLMVTLPSTSISRTKNSREYEITRDDYVFAYPIVTMDASMRQLIRLFCGCEAHHNLNFR